MKKKLLALIAVVTAMGMLAGCGSNATSLRNMDVDKYVTLGEYKGLAVTVAAPTVDEVELEDLMLSIYTTAYPEEKGVTDRAVKVGDTANIDYEGKKDGVAFEGGTAQGSNLTIGSGQFIDGFEDGLVGVKPGETVDLDLFFPENYGNAELAGQAVVFTVTVNYIIPADMDDTVIATLGIPDVTNEEELYQYVYDYLYAYAEENRLLEVENAVLDSFMAGCVFEEVPESLVEKYEANTRKNIEATAATYGMDAETFVNYYYMTDVESFVASYCEDAVKQDIAMQAIANRENLNISDEELDATLLEYAEAAGFTTIEEYIGDDTKEDYREYFMYEKVLAYIVENAVVSE